LKTHRHLVVIGDRVLIQPDSEEERTEVGLYLPKWAVERETVQGGRIIATGPGTPLPQPGDIENEPWKSYENTVHYLPMQVQMGDYAIFLRKSAIEIKFEDKNYLVVPQAAILVVIREKEFDEDV